MRSPEDHLKTLPLHQQDQALAAADDEQRYMQALVAVSTLVGSPKYVSNDPDQSSRAIEYLNRILGTPSFCTHIKRSPNQPAWLFVGLDRREAKCRVCMEVLTNDPIAMRRVVADNRCELCLAPTLYFHADAISFAVAVPGGLVSVAAVYEACTKCHKASGMPTTEEER